MLSRSHEGITKKSIARSQEGIISKGNITQHDDALSITWRPFQSRSSLEAVFVLVVRCQYFIYWHSRFGSAIYDPWFARSHLSLLQRSLSDPFFVQVVFYYAQACLCISGRELNALHVLPTTLTLCCMHLCNIDLSRMFSQIHTLCPWPMRKLFLISNTDACALVGGWDMC